MNDKFSLEKYASRLFKEMVLAFETSNHATHPVAVGSGKEKSVMQKLEHLLPAGVGVGSGFVYDLHGNVSGQCDIVLFEKDFCLKAIPNEDEGNAFYNCESVIAVGEIKSSLTRAEFVDCLAKFSRLTKLTRGYGDGRRQLRRQYLTKTVFEMDGLARKRGLDEIFKFIICEEVKISPNLICSVIAEKKPPKASLPNEFLDLLGFSISYLDSASVTFSPSAADLLVFQKDKQPSDTFSRFLYHLVGFINAGLTVPLNYDSYYRDKANLSPISTASLAKIYQ